jgi:6-phosphogluconolactonase
MRKTIEVLPTLDTLTQRALEIVLTQMQIAITERGQFTLVLSGGSTPKALYAELAKQPLPLEHLHLFWGDERYVPADHPDSNQRMARQAWLNHVDIPAQNVHPMPTMSQDPILDAEHYESELRDFFSFPSDQWPMFDLILLGMGDDGHTASLFPHTAALQVSDRWITVGEKDSSPRLTFTVPLINNARCVLFTVAGATKQAALRQVFAASASNEAYPTRLIRPQQDEYWLLDQSLAEGLEPALLQQES